MCRWRNPLICRVQVENQKSQAVNQSECKDMRTKKSSVSPVQVPRGRDTYIGTEDGCLLSGSVSLPSMLSTSF